MSRHRMLIAFAAISASCASAARALERASDAISEFIIVAARCILSLVARPEPMLAGNGGFTGLLVGHGRGYDAPPIHSLRHEAGTVQRAAPRNI